MHEVRNPVHALDLHLRVLERARDEEGRTAAVALCRGEIVALRNVVDTFLDRARLDAAAREDTDVVAVIEGVLTRMRGVWPTVELDVRAPDGRHFRLDPRLLELAVANLVANACQAISASGTGSRVDVAVRYDGHQVRLSVRDDGPGVPLALADRLFAPFVTGRAAGIGLGLAVVRRAAQAHGGTARFVLTEGSGAQFDLQFPAQVAHPRDALA